MEKPQTPESVHKYGGKHCEAKAVCSQNDQYLGEPKGDILNGREWLFFIGIQEKWLDQERLLENQDQLKPHSYHTDQCCLQSRPAFLGVGQGIQQFHYFHLILGDAGRKTFRAEC